MNKLNILWTTDNKETVQHMLVMYAINSKANGWWDEVTIIIWGASAKLAGTDAEVQADIREMLENGITIEACKACTEIHPERGNCGLVFPKSSSLPGRFFLGLSEEVCPVA